MAQIKKISFARVGKNEGCTCDKCGQYIRNIWTVDYADGVRLNLGIDCFDKLNKSSNLTTYGLKLFKQAMKSIEDHQRMFEEEKALTEETDIRYQATQTHVEWKEDDYWMGHPWEEYHKWMIEEWWPTRFKEDQKKIDRFGKVNFAR